MQKNAIMEQSSIQEPVLLVRLEGEAAERIIDALRESCGITYKYRKNMVEIYSEK